MEHEIQIDNDEKDAEIEAGLREQGDNEAADEFVATIASLKAKLRAAEQKPQTATEKAASRIAVSKPAPQTESASKATQQLAERLTRGMR